MYTIKKCFPLNHKFKNKQKNERKLKQGEINL